MPLTDLEVRRAAPRAKTYRISDGRGMYLEIAPTGGKYWRLKYRFLDREKRLALGVYPDVTLAHARRKREEARAMLADGVDPGQAKKEKQRVARLNAVATFEAVALEWFERQAPGWAITHSEKIMGRLKKDLFPWLGSRPIADITPAEVFEVLRRAESRRGLRYCASAASELRSSLPLRRRDRARHPRCHCRPTRRAATESAHSFRVAHGSRKGWRDAPRL